MFSPSCTEFVNSECWHFDNVATSMIHGVLIEHGDYCCGNPHIMLKCFEVVGGGLQDSRVIPSPLRTNLVFELIGTWLGLG